MQCGVFLMRVGSSASLARRLGVIGFSPILLGVPQVALVGVVESENLVLCAIESSPILLGLLGSSPYLKLLGVLCRELGRCVAFGIFLNCRVSS